MRSPSASRIIGMLALASLAACAKPVTNAPKVSADELAQERSVHEQAVAAAQRSAGAKSIDRNVALNGLNAVAARVAPAAAPYCQQFIGRSPCPFAIALDKDSAPLNAYADGKNVVISPAMVAFTQSPDELAAVVAHEMAHNILAHPAKAQQNATVGALAGTALDAAANAYGFNLGGMKLGNLGAQMGGQRYSQDFERDADYLGAYIMHNAGYNVDAIPVFWQRMSVENKQAIYTATSHPTNPERSVMLRKAIAEIRSKQQAGKQLTPELRPTK